MKRRIISLVMISIFTVVSVFAQTSADRYNTTYVEEPKNLNYLYLIDTTSQRIAANTQDQLVEQDKFGRFIPCLAQSWVATENSSIWTFTIKKGMKWVDHLGKVTAYEVTADDFVEGMRYVADPKNAIKNVSSIKSVLAGLNGYYTLLQDIASGKVKDKTREQALATFDASVGIKAIDKYTIQYKMAKPTPWFLSYLTMDMFNPLEKAFFDKIGAADFGTSKERLIYSGAYYLSDYTRDKQIVLTRNDSNWDSKKVRVKTISMQKVADPAITLQMFMRGELSQTTLTADQVKGLAGTKYDQYVWQADLSTVTYWYEYNFLTRNPEFAAFVNNQNFRKALYYGIDHSKLLALYDPVNPNSASRSTIIPENTVLDEKGRDYTDFPGLKDIKALGVKTYDPVKAREYFAKAVAELTDGKGNIKGVTAGTVDMKPMAQFDVDGKLPLQMLFTHGPDSLWTKYALLFQAIMKDTFGAQNVEVVLGQWVDDQFGQSVQPGLFDITRENFRFSYADPMAQLGRLTTNGGVNAGGYSDLEIDALIKEADSKVVLSDRYSIFAKAEKLLIDRAYIIPYMAAGGEYTMSKAPPYTVPRGGFGVTRFKYKGMIVDKNIVTAKRFQELKTAFYAEMEKAIAK